MTSVELLMQEFTQICSGSSTAAIKNAQNKLLELQKDPSFISYCSIILEESQVMTQLKKLIVVYLQKYSKRINKQKNHQKTVNTIQQFLALISNLKISIDFKPFITAALESIINLQANRPMKIQLSITLINELRESITKADDNINFAYLIFCGKALFGTHNYNQQATDFTKGTFKQYLTLHLRLLSIASGCSIQSKQSMLLVYKLLKEYSSLLKTFLKRMGVLDIDGTKLLYLSQLQLCITTALSLNVKGNSIDSSLFVLIPNQYQISRIINSVKNNYINCISSFVRLLNAFVRHANLLNSNPLYIKLGTLLDYFIKSTSTLLEITPYHSLPIQSGLLENLDELFNLYVHCLRINDFYPVFSQNKSDLIEKIALPCLALTPYQASAFYEDPQQFIQSSLQVVDRNIKPAGYNEKAHDDENFIRQYQTLKTYSAQFLSSLCKFQDGTLTHIYQHALGIIQNKINSPYSKSTMLMVIACLKDHLKERKDLKAKLGQVFMVLFEAVPIPVVSKTKKQADIQYAYLLLAISRLVLGLKQIYPQIIQKSFKLGIAVMQSATTSEVHKSFVLDLFDAIIRIEQGQKFIFDIVAIFNHLLATCSQLSLHLLDSYFDLIKYNAQELRKNPASTLQGLKLLAQHIVKEVQKPQPVQMLINKCWNIVRQVGESENFIPQLIPNIEQIVMPLVPYIDGITNLDFQEDILLLMTAFIDKGKKVTLNQQKMFEIIPKIFYNQYFCRFGQAFHTIQLFIYYGSQVLKNAFPAIKAIVDMSMTSITQSEYKGKPVGQIQNCQGALILQSLVAKCGDVFTLQMWSVILKGILSRLDRNVSFTFLSSNLYALLALCLVHSYKFFNDEENQVLLNRILNKIGLFANMQYSPKVLIAALTQLLMHYSAPFVGRRFGQILDITISMLELSSNKKENLFGNEEEEDEQKQYCNSVLLVKNDMKILDQFNYFKKKIQQLKNQNRQLLVNSIAQFPQAKKEYFMNILTIEKVANVPRKIYKIKK